MHDDDNDDNDAHQNDRDEQADDDDFEFDPSVPIEIPIETTLDLHPFLPAEVKSVVEEYLGVAHARGFAEVRLIHGKGTGTLKRTVRALLERHPLVASFHDDEARGGNWGATVVGLKLG
jgi:DNA-nicking Smr family endonuclease